MIGRLVGYLLSAVLLAVPAVLVLGAIALLLGGAAVFTVFFPATVSLITLALVIGYVRWRRRRRRALAVLDAEEVEH